MTLLLVPDAGCLLLIAWQSDKTAISNVPLIKREKEIFVMTAKLLPLRFTQHKKTACANYLPLLTNNKPNIKIDGKIPSIFNIACNFYDTNTAKLSSMQIT